ncbi:MAG TPA: hypothetical protein DDZ51_08030 [Planctomycetaceae bacterium]|nr:hypothetical protein [Planctomycetaceae bacterium]
MAHQCIRDVLMIPCRQRLPATSQMRTDRTHPLIRPDIRAKTDKAFIAMEGPCNGIMLASAKLRNQPTRQMNRSL